MYKCVWVTVSKLSEQARGSEREEKKGDHGCARGEKKNKRVRVPVPATVLGTTSN